MKKETSLNELLIEELSELLNVENQLIEFLPRMSGVSHAKVLKRVLEKHLEETKRQSRRLQDIFSNTNQNPQQLTCRPIKDLINELEYAIKQSKNEFENDSDIINVAQRMKRFEITSYSTVQEHAANLGHTKIVELMEKSLNEERQMNLHLNELSQRLINSQAISPNRNRFSKLIIVFIALCFVFVFTRFAKAGIPIVQTDSQIMGVLIQLDQKQIQEGRLAQQKNINLAVSGYANQVANDDSDHLDKSNQLVENLNLKNVDDPTLEGLRTQNEQDITSLEALDGLDFSQLYIADAIKDYSETLNWLNRQQAGNKQVQTFLTESKRIITNHFQKAQQIQQEQLRQQ